MSKGTPKRATLKTLASGFLGAAQNQPDRQAEIYHKAAATFMGLASKPENARLQAQLHSLAQQFSHAAQRPPTVEDFNNLLQETAEAYEEVGGDDDVDLVARRREIHDDRAPEGRPISIAPASINQDTPLGRIATIKFAPTSEEVRLGVVQSQTVAFWQGTKREAQAVTVDVGLVEAAVVLPPGVQEPTCRPFGIVVFGSDGGRTTAKFDLAYGQRFTVVGNYVSILVGMDPPPPDRPSIQLTVSASIGMFAAPSQSPVLFTSYIDNLADGASTGLIARPAKSILLLPPRIGFLGGSILLETFDLGGGPNPIDALSIPNSPQNTPIPLVNDAAFFRVTNTSVKRANIRLPFQLCL